MKRASFISILLDVFDLEAVRVCYFSLEFTSNTAICERVFSVSQSAFPAWRKRGRDMIHRESSRIKPFDNAFLLITITVFSLEEVEGAIVRRNYPSYSYL